MEHQLQGVLAFDIAGWTRLTPERAVRIVTGLREAVDEAGSLDVKAFLVGDSGILVFHNCRDSYPALRSLVSRWANVKESSATPLLVGLRLGLDAGTMVARSDLVVGQAITVASLLANEGSVDVCRISDQAYRCVGHLFVRDGLKLVRQSFHLRGGLVIEGYEVGLGEFLKPDQYLVRMQSPTDLLLYLASRPQQLLNIPPRTFERVIAELLSDFGYEIELTKQTRDNGIDIIAIKREMNLNLPERYLVQCKRNAPVNKVGVAVVHELLGVGATEPHTGLIIVTTSSFTKPALSLARKESARWRLHLKDYGDIQKWLQTYVHRRSP